MSRLMLHTLLWILFWTSRTFAHDHDDISEEDLSKPLDSVLWIHIFIQFLVWGIIFPTGMVLGLVRQRLHVPLQLLGYLLTAGGYILGHAHGGRMFRVSVHGKTASYLILPIAMQFCLGVYLKLHIHEGTIFRRYMVKAHGILGASYPVLGWTQILFGCLTAGGYCLGDNLGQCLAHYIMGSSFVAYGILMAILLVVGGDWLERRGNSPEWWDSWIIMLWGAVNTFTEHRGTHWSHKDMQHTSLGVLWWSGGALGVWNSRAGQRSIIPSIIILLTGWAMSVHTQGSQTSTKVHAIFGLTLSSAAIARMVEIIILSLRLSSMKATVGPFQHLPPFLLIAAGLLFMSATDEELLYVDSINMDHVTYILIIFSAAFMLYLFSNILLHLYSSTGRNASEDPTPPFGHTYQPLAEHGDFSDNYHRQSGGSESYEMRSSTLATADDVDELK